jgi:hypothetical protein
MLGLVANEQKQIQCDVCVIIIWKEHHNQQQVKPVRVGWLINPQA